MKTKMKKLFALLAVMTLMFSMNVNAAEDNSLDYTDVAVSGSTELAQITDIQLDAGSGVCEVDIQLQQTTGGTLSFSNTSGTAGTVSASVEAGYTFNQFRYRVVKNTGDNSDAGWDLVDGVYDQSKDTIGEGFVITVDETAGSTNLGVSISRTGTGNIAAHLEPEYIVAVTADFVEIPMSRVTIDPIIYEVLEDGSYVENTSAGHLVLSNVNSDKQLISVLDSNNTGDVITETLEIGTKVEFEALKDGNYVFVGWKWNLENPNQTPRTNPRWKNIVNGTESFSPTPVFKAVEVVEPPTQVDEVTITVVSAGAGSGTISVESGVLSGPAITVPVGSPLTFSAVASAGSVFDGWDEEPSTATGTATYTATFSLEDDEDEPSEPETPSEPEAPTPTAAPVTNYVLTVAATDGGTVPGFLGNNTFGSGTVVNLGVTVEDGYEFTGWTGDVSNDKVTMTSDKSVTANFELIIEEEPTPEAPVEEPEEEVILDEEITESSPTDTIEDEALPQTGGIPMSVMSGFGLALSGLGFKLRKRK